MDHQQAELSGSLLTMADGRCFALQDAVRILGHAKLETDPYGLTGVVVAVRCLLQRGFTMNASQAALGRVIYDVEHGFLAQLLNDEEDTPIAVGSG